MSKKRKLQADQRTESRRRALRPSAATRTHVGGRPDSSESMRRQYARPDRWRHRHADTTASRATALASSTVPGLAQGVANSRESDLKRLPSQQSACSRPQSSSRGIGSLEQIACDAEESADIGHGSASTRSVSFSASLINKARSAVVASWVPSLHRRKTSPAQGRIDSAASSHLRRASGRRRRRGRRAASFSRHSSARLRSPHAVVPLPVAADGQLA